MIVGFMRNAKNPADGARLTAMLCKYHNIDLLYFGPGDVDIENNKVIGKMYINGKWKKVKQDIPPVVDAYPYSFRKKHEKVIKHLRSHVSLTYDKEGSFNKEKLQKELEKDEKFAHLVIPTRKLTSFEDIDGFLHDYGTVVLKPVHGEKGKGVHVLRKEEDFYLLGYQTLEQRLKREELEAYYTENMKNKNFILQKYISSRTRNGDPFDCRIHVQKNRYGNWETARRFIRIGIGQKVMSNVNQGGGISDAEPFLKANFPEQWEEINEKLNRLAHMLPYKIEEIKQTPTMAIGFDVAIDKNGDLYVFESNGSPSTAFLPVQAALLRTDYYLHLLENRFGKTEVKKLQETDVKSLKEENRLLQQKLKGEQEKNKTLRRRQADLTKEKDHFKKKYFAVVNSKSWRLTALIRLPLGVLKRVKKAK